MTDEGLVAKAMSKAIPSAEMRRTELTPTEASRERTLSSVIKKIEKKSISWQRYYDLKPTVRDRTAPAPLSAVRYCTVPALFP